MNEMKKPVLMDDNGTFELEDADLWNDLYFPLAGEYGLKSSITPTLAGDAKTDQNHFLLSPVSILDLSDHRLARNFWCIVDGTKVWSASGNSAKQNAERLTAGEKERCKVRAGYMWHEVTRENKDLEIKASITSFIPYDVNTEVHIIRLENIGEESHSVRFFPAYPIYGRSADNIRDHRHVTALLGRVEVTDRGIIDHPTFSFDERGHQPADAMYFAETVDEDGEFPETFYPVLSEFVGRGTPDWPEAIVATAAKGAQATEGCGRVKEPMGFFPGDRVDGQEAIGAFRFGERHLGPGEEMAYVVYAGIVKDEAELRRIRESIGSLRGAEESLKHTKSYWISKVNIRFHTGNRDFDRFMRWTAFQPELRRIFGCSFLPHHDYGKGGRGWRDLWQDCLALLMMDPSGVKQMLLGNFAGVRIDGTNATIIGSRIGEFKADRNSITRVWMDHGVWPYLTTALYIHQTGDVSILLEECSYFCDRQIFRGQKFSEAPAPEGGRLLNDAGAVYMGTVLEHLLIQNLTAFWEVGEHNMIRLRDADWNDALDMAGARGESVAFASAYAGNLEALSKLLRSGILPVTKIHVLEQLGILLRDEEALYEDAEGKQALLEEYMAGVASFVEAGRIAVDTAELAENLHRKAEWLKKRIREEEWIEGKDGEGWFNGYYDNSGRKLDLSIPGKKNMTLTGQVFSVMNGIADRQQTEKIVKSADSLLYDAEHGGYRLNTDFGEVKTDMGRMFGFAYGEKENGAVFSHMAVMYAYALYQQGFAKEGYKALNTLFTASTNFQTSRIYPGIPEYFGYSGRGLYSYLTGAASWYLLTVVMKMFGVRGEYGNLVLDPALLKDQFDEKGTCGLELEFAGKPFKILYRNPEGLEYGSYRVGTCRVDGREVTPDRNGDGILIGKNVTDLLDPNVRHLIEIELCK